MERPGLSWTIVTVERLQAERPADRLCFISGSEGFLKIRTWKNYRDLLRAVSFIIVLRKDGHRQRVKALLTEEGVPICSEAAPLSAAGECAAIFPYDAESLGISSTMIRERLKSGEPIDSFVDVGVKKIIEEFALYETG
jgi:nicotinate-nucleotide adenylyltransferase